MLQNGKWSLLKSFSWAEKATLHVWKGSIQCIAQTFSRSPYSNFESGIEHYDRKGEHPLKTFPLSDNPTIPP
ncbi:hypothetical protein J3R74_001958 [Puniceicoccus vermicola]